MIISHTFLAVDGSSWQFGHCCSGILYMVPYWDVSVSLMIRSEKRCVWKEDRRERAPGLSHPVGVSYEGWRSLCSADLTCRLSGFPVCGYFSLPLYIVVWGRVTLCSPRLVVLGLLKHGVAMWIIWSFSAREICLFSPLNSLFNHLFIGLLFLSKAE